MTQESTSGQAGGEPAGDRGALSLRGFFLAGVRLAKTRLQILSTEIAEQKVRLTLAAITGVAGLFLLGLAVVLGVALLAVLFWEEHRVALLTTLTLLFGVLGGGLLALTIRSVSGKERLFEATIGELQKDENVWRAGQQND